MTAKVVMLTGVALGLMLSACVVDQGNLTSAADRLERASLVLAEDAHERRRDRDYDSRDYSREARALADQAREFRVTVEEHHPGDRHDVKGSFDQVSRRYHDLRDEVEHSEGRRTHGDMKRVTEAYLDIEREMGGYRR